MTKHGICLVKGHLPPDTRSRKELVEIGKAIVNKCGGLPIALTMLGNLLYMKRDRREWLAIKENNIWDTKTSILPALRLSYKHLPLHSRRCFAFCAVFPKDREMDKEVLINMWMAHGFIPSDGGRLEVKGNEIFNQLVQRSFLQDVKEEKSDYYTKTCRMHDLVHDLAQSILENAYHLLISDGILNIKNTLKQFPNLRTILSAEDVEYDGNIPGPTSLRVLQLPYGKLPTSMKFVRHLRYLRLSIYLTELPESICTLLHLQTLELSKCTQLVRLPKRMVCMISLKHLYLDDCVQLETMAPGMGRMTNLQTLTHYAVSEETGTGIGELKELRLSSRLAVRNLELVKDAKEAREINLQSKEDLTSLLLLEWTSTEGGINNAEQVLEELKPPRFLKFLIVRNYHGLKFPSWMKDLHHLVKLRLENCTGLHRLPPLWQLNSLEELYLRNMYNLEYIISDNTTMQASHSLRKLKLYYLVNLKGWWENENNPQQEGMKYCFPALVNLLISHCPELAGSIPMAPCLKSLDLLHSRKIPLGSISSLTSLISLRIVNSGEEEEKHDRSDLILPDEIVALRNLQCLENLMIEGSREVALVWRHEADDQDKEGSGQSSLKLMMLINCSWIFSWARYDGFWTCMASLERLDISECNALVAFPYKALQSLKSLRELFIWKCDNMTDKSPAIDSGSIFLPQLEVLKLYYYSRLETVPPIWGPSLKSLEIVQCESLVSLVAAEQELGRIPSLESMTIKKCPILKSLPILFLSTLKHLDIEDCPELAKKCARGGEYWNFVSNIPNLRTK